MKLRSVMTHQFSQVPQANIPRSTFDRTSGYKTTFNAGYLIPFFVDEALPGDDFKVQVSMFARLATPIVPVMDNMFCETFFFAVPNRLIWNNWEKMNGQQDNPGDSTDYMTPVMNSGSGGGWAVGTLSDYLGLPTDKEGIEACSFWHRAYNLIWNTWFRDENLQDSVVVDKDDGPDSKTDYVLLRRGKRHDYFTSALPWPQKGDAVLLPLGSTAPVVRDPVGGPNPMTFYNGTEALYLRTTSGSSATSWSATATATSNALPGNAAGENTGLITDLSAATAATVNQMRQAFQIQKIYERDARGGTRYTETIRAHFGVVSPDARLQRPEYLGGGSTQITFTPIAQTSESNTTPQGNLAATAVMSASGHGFSKGFTEHCVLLGLVCVRADINYQQGLPRMFSRRTRWDFYWPELNAIGEQAILNQEIYCSGTNADFDVFGYQERYAEYRYKQSQITGKFRSTASGTLDIWHLAQKFTTLPVLDDTFIVENPPVDRIVAVPSEPQFLFDAYIKMKCARPMPTYGVPGLIDHF